MDRKQDRQRASAVSQNYRYHVCPLVRTIQIFKKSQPFGSRYHTSLLLTDLSMGECRLHFVQGHLDDEINASIAKLCHQLGYKKIQFEVPHGTGASRYAKLDWSDGVLDRYTVDLDD